MSILKFLPNQPQSVALKFREPKHVSGKYGEQAMYSLEDGSLMYVPPIVEKKIQDLNATPGQRLTITKEKAESGKVTWNVALAVERKPQQAATIIERSEALDGYDAAATPGQPQDGKIPTQLEFALKTALHAAKQAEAYSREIGHPVVFDKDDVRLLAQTLVIGARGRAA